jgi:hypothetical protein
MTGGLIQLISRGIIDTFITESPEITFFKSVFHRHTNFAIETYEDVFNGPTSFGSTSMCKINNYGDLVSDMILRVELPSLNLIPPNLVCVNNEINDCYCNKCRGSAVFSWANAIGHVMIDYVELHIGGKMVDRQYGEWLEVWTELVQTNEKRQGYYEMIGKVEPAAFKHSFRGPLTLFIPMNFWFCRNVGYALPLLSLYYEEVYLKIKWRNFNDCYVSSIPGTKCPPVNIFNCSLLIDHIFLDISEREKFLTQTQMYVIDQVQFNEYNFSKAVRSASIDLSIFVHPVKELIWAIQRADIGFNDGISIINDWYNYSPEKDRKNMKKQFINETFGSAKLTINGVERFRELPSTYFRLVQPYKYHTRVPTNYIYNYSFSLKPEELQPTGACDFSMLSNIYLQLKNVNMNSDYIVKVWALNLNLLLITDGLSGLAAF